MQGNDTQNLEEYFNSDNRIGILYHPYVPPKWINNSINIKREKIKTKARLFAETLDENDLNAVIQKDKLKGYFLQHAGLFQNISSREAFEEKASMPSLSNHSDAKSLK